MSGRIFSRVWMWLLGPEVPARAETPRRPFLLRREARSLSEDMVLKRLAAQRVLIEERRKLHLVSEKSRAAR